MSGTIGRTNPRQICDPWVRWRTAGGIPVVAQWELRFMCFCAALKASWVDRHHLPPALAPCAHSQWDMSSPRSRLLSLNDLDEMFHVCALFTDGPTMTTS